MKKHSHLVFSNSNTQGVRYLQTISNASERMAHLIDDLLEFSCLGRQTLAVADIEMCSLVASALRSKSAARCRRAVTASCCC